MAFQHRSINLRIHRLLYPDTLASKVLVHVPLRLASYLRGGLSCDAIMLPFLHKWRTLTDAFPRGMQSRCLIKSGN